MGWWLLLRELAVGHAHPPLRWSGVDPGNKRSDWEPYHTYDCRCREQRVGSRRHICRNGAHHALERQHLEPRAEQQYTGRRDNELGCGVVERVVGRGRSFL